MSTHNICFCREIRKSRYSLFEKSALSRAMWRYQNTLWWIILNRVDESNWDAVWEKVPYAPSKDLDQPEHSCSLIRVFTECILDNQGCKVLSRRQWRLWSDCTDAQVDLSLLSARMSEGTFFYIVVQLVNHHHLSRYGATCGSRILGKWILAAEKRHFWVSCLQSSHCIQTPKSPKSSCPCDYLWPV